MTTFVVAAMCALGMGGLWLIVAGSLAHPQDLRAVTARLHTPRLATTAAPTFQERAVQRLAGEPSLQTRKDLAVCELSQARWVADRFSWAMFASVAPLAMFGLTSTGTLSVIAPLWALVAVPVGFAAGWFYAAVALVSDAETARRKVRHAVGVYLEIVTIQIAGGAGPESALYNAAELGEGSSFRHIRSALAAARMRREPPWDALGRLGDELGVDELVELRSSMTLAGGGAQVKASLVAKAAAIREKSLAEIESEQHSRSETMSLPVVLMFAGIMLLLGYPAFSGLSQI